MEIHFYHRPLNHIPSAPERHEREEGLVSVWYCAACLSPFSELNEQSQGKMGESGHQCIVYMGWEMDAGTDTLNRHVPSKSGRARVQLKVDTTYLHL